MQLEVGFVKPWMTTEAHGKWMWPVQPRSPPPVPASRGQGGPWEMSGEGRSHIKSRPSAKGWLHTRRGRRKMWQKKHCCGSTVKWEQSYMSATYLQENVLWTTLSPPSGRILAPLCPCVFFSQDCFCSFPGSRKFADIIRTCKLRTGTDSDSPRVFVT